MNYILRNFVTRAIKGSGLEYFEFFFKAGLITLRNDFSYFYFMLAIFPTFSPDDLSITEEAIHANLIETLRI